MKKRSFMRALLVVLMTVILGGCGCLWQHMKGETPPPPPPPAPAVVQPAPEPPPPPPPPAPAKPDRN